MFETRIIYFVQYLMAPIILLLGLIGNMLGFAVFARKPIRKIGPQIIYTFLFACDTLYLVCIIVNYLEFGFVYDITVVSKYICKLYWYVQFVSGPISPMLLCFISLEKVLSMKSPSRAFFLRRKDVQAFFLVTTVAFNAVFYLPISFAFHVNAYNETLLCEGDPELFGIINYMDLANRVALPFLFMIINSIFLLTSIHRMRQRIAENFRSNSNQNYRINISLMFSLFLLNIVYIFSALPISIVSIYLPISDIATIATLYLNYLPYSINFYIIFSTNSLFRKEFMSIIFK